MRERCMRSRRINYRRRRLMHTMLALTHGGTADDACSMYSPINLIVASICLNLLNVVTLFLAHQSSNDITLSCSSPSWSSSFSISTPDIIITITRIYLTSYPIATVTNRKLRFSTFRFKSCSKSCSKSCLTCGYPRTPGPQARSEPRASV